ncbi:MAG TPA: NERD domain-containing protein [Ilumatobacteraceae bacterium]|nr:NERD domain-containing protein [Ilumatobacteraceae bacterium]
MNDGELRVADALARLDDEWTVYVQPRLALDVPDFVVVHPRHGVCAIEVKDWSSGTRYRQDERGGIEYRGRDGTWRCSADKPRYQAFRYSQVIFDQFFALSEHDTASSPAVRAALILPRHTTDQARRLLELAQVTPEEHIVEVWGGDALVTGIERVVRGIGCPPPPALSIERLRRHLSESELIGEWRGSRPLSAGVRNIETNPRGAKVRRVRGPAGSGKSFGLAARAARLASTGQSVAVVTCNVTLSHYLRAHVTRRCHEYAADPTLVTVVDFHGLCQRVADDALHAGVEQVAGDAPWPERIVAEAANAYAHGHGPVFDAVLVDEGQDFTLEWWNLLRQNVCRPDGEMLLVSDPTQDLYDKRAWVEEDSMAGAGFSGPWAELEGSYRLPSDIVPIANEFSLRYLDGERLAVSVPDDRHCVSGRTTPSVRRWLNVSPIVSLGRQIGYEVAELLDRGPDLSPADVVFLCESHADGLQAVKVIQACGIEVHHVFADDRRERARRERRFWPDGPGVKGCTVQGFKGWESRAVVMGIDTWPDALRRTYVALTRVKADRRGRPTYISVVNGDPSMARFGEFFENPVVEWPAPSPTLTRSREVSAP